MFKGIHSLGCLKIVPDNNCLFTSISFRELHVWLTSVWQYLCNIISDIFLKMLQMGGCDVCFSIDIFDWLDSICPEPLFRQALVNRRDKRKNFFKRKTTNLWVGNQGTFSEFSAFVSRAKTKEVMTMESHIDSFSLTFHLRSLAELIVDWHIIQAISLQKFWSSVWWCWRF